MHQSFGDVATNVDDFKQGVNEIIRLINQAAHLMPLTQMGVVLSIHLPYFLETTQVQLATLHFTLQQAQIQVRTWAMLGHLRVKKWL